MPSMRAVDGPLTSAAAVAVARWLRKFPAQLSTDALAPQPERADGVQVEPIFAKLAQFGVRVLVNARVSVPPGTLRCCCHRWCGP